MDSIRFLMAEHHRACDEAFASAESAVMTDHDWAGAGAAFSAFHDMMRRHFDAEEKVLFPAFEQRTGMSMGPTQVMRGEHIQIRELMEAMNDAIVRKDADDYSGHAETLLIMTQQHNMKEENILYPMCDQHLVAQFDSLRASLRHMLDGKGI